MDLIPIPDGLQTRFFVLSGHALDDLPELLKTAFPGKRPWIVADGNTMQAAGFRAQKLIETAGLNPFEPFVFPGSPRLHPEYAHAEMLSEIMPENCVPVAVGSGVINDLTKCASGIKNVPYCCVPTACSVDGYTAAGAALAVNDTKKTVPCPAPMAVCADVSVLKTAPPEMFAAGYADLLAKLPAGADWLLADAVGEEAIRPDVWEMIQTPLRSWVSGQSDLLNVFHGLAATGYSMQMYLDSRPASGMEHLLSHVWEMEKLSHNGEEVSHGFKVGIGLLVSFQLMDYILRNTPETLREKMRPALSREERLAEIDKLLAKGCYGTAPIDTAMKKFIEPEAMEERRKMLLAKLPEIQSRFKKQLISLDEIRTMLESAACPVKPSEIGLTQEQYLHAVPTAQLIRVRYTLLDYLYELGLLDDAVSTLQFS